MLIPQLFNVFRLRAIPTILRASSLSLLADAIDTYPLVMLPYSDDLSQAMVDLLQVESEPGRVAASTPNKDTQESMGPVKDNGNENPGAEPTGDNDHLTANPRHPPLKRAAIHLLGRLVQSTLRELDDEAHVVPFSANFLTRARITLGYVASTDQDNVTRAMAREVRDEITAFESRLLGQDI